MHDRKLHRRELTGAALLAAVLASGCAVRSTYVKPDFDRTDRHTLKRIAVLAAPLPASPPQAAALLARIASRYIHQHKDYLVASDGALGRADAWRQQCGERVHGVVRLLVASLAQTARDLTLDMTADLHRCDSSVLVWRVEIRDTLLKRDEDLAQLSSVYRRQFGEVADTLAAPLFIAVKTALASLPTPSLSEEETMEKISAAEP